jgi:hypothetical protein
MASKLPPSAWVTRYGAQGALEPAPQPRDPPATPPTHMSAQQLAALLGGDRSPPG